jgi:serine protease Do
MRPGEAPGTAMSDVGGALAATAARLRRSTVRVHDAAGRGSGSGVVWSRGDVIVTNAHVVCTRDAVVEYAGGRRVRARVVARDTSRDLAALHVPGAALPAAEVRPSSGLLAGELVLAVGNPLGLVGALSVGLVQRCSARWVIADVKLAPGNSGGPLADAAGRVVGINSMVAGGLAYAVRSDAVATLLERLRLVVTRAA